AGVYVVWDAVIDLRRAASPEHGWLGVGVMLVSTVVNVLLSHRVLTIARETESIALRAEGQHIRTDVWTSAGVLGTLLITRIASIPHLQSVAALCVSVLIFRAGYKVVVMALQPLVDAALPPDETLAIHKVLSSDPQVCGYHNLRTRRSGATRMVDLHVMLPDDMTFVEAHHHAEMLEHNIEMAFSGNTDVIIHAEPYMAEREHQEVHHSLNPFSLKPPP
ncbi:MAG: cation diffusion facilitator family transporter, partial [Chloroflexi bacterium]|nr:cation diffusion facilitator family transporter [Chloroflexota bacterium]